MTADEGGALPSVATIEGWLRDRGDGRDDHRRIPAPGAPPPAGLRRPGRWRLHGRS